MKISREDLSWAAAKASLDPADADALWAALEERTQGAPRFTFATVAYSFGAMIVISAMGWFMTLGWESFGGFGIFAIAVGVQFQKHHAAIGAAVTRLVPERVRALLPPARE